MRLLLACAIGAVIASGCGPGAAKAPLERRALPDTARIVCTVDSTRLLTPAVRPRSDGVHVILSQHGGAPATLDSDQAGGWRPQPKPFVVALPPATHTWAV
jgi:hypothetical protein